jgi:hypothetical protein
MKQRRITYFISGLLIQLSIIAAIVYWFTLVASNDLREAIHDFSVHLPSFLQDATLVLIITAAFTAISMLCYSMARKLSYNMYFRNLILGLILINAIILIWILLTLM